MRRRPDSFARRGVARAAVAFAIACLAAAVAPAWAGTAPAKRPVMDPYYGDALFYYFEEHYFTALTHLMAAQSQFRVPHHEEDAELLRAGLLLSYGMHAQAGEAFERLIARGASPAAQDRAWYFLARIRYQRGYIDLAEDAIGRIAGRLPEELETDRVLLQSNLLMARGRYADAAAILKDRGGDKGPALYARYNLGVALFRAGDVRHGSELLERVGRAEGGDEETLALRDKANVALGFAALRDKLPERAALYLERVRLGGMLATRALLGFGWADMAREQPQRALVAWNELASRDTSDAAVLEARLATPYAMAQLGGFTQALQGYEDALRVFERERGRIDEAIATVRSGAALRALLSENPVEGRGWNGGLAEVTHLPGAPYLVTVLASHEFQEAFKGLRDIRMIEGNLGSWEERLTQYQELVGERRKAFAERLPLVTQRQRELGVELAAERRESIAGQLDEERLADEPERLADAHERELLERIERDRNIASAMGEGADSDAARERLRRVQGALTWKLSQEFAGRLREEKMRLREVDEGLARVRASQGKLSAAQRDEPPRFARFAARGEELLARVRRMRGRAVDLDALQERALEDLVVASLEQEKEWLAGYATQARFAMAQIYDRANMAKEPASAPQP